MTIKLSKVEERYVRQLIADRKYTSAKEDLRGEIDSGLRDIENGRLIDWDAESLKCELLQKTRKVS
jgi:hypothetical protein